MTLSLYLTRRLAGTFAMVAAVFFGMLFLFEAVEMVRRFGGNGAGLGRLLMLSALRVPQTLYQILPLLTILSSMALFLALARSSELVVIRAAGRSALRMLLAPFIAVLLFGVLAVSALNPMSAAASRIYHAQVRAMEAPEQTEQMSVSEAGIWLRQGDASGQTVIRAAGISADGQAFEGMTFLAFDQASGSPVSRIEAAAGRLTTGAWALEEVKQWDLHADNPEREARHHATLSLPTDLTPERIRDSFARSGTISVWALPEFIRALDRAGLATRDHRARLQSELALPLLLGGMMLIGAVFCLRHARGGQTDSRILITVLAGFALFFLRNFAQVLGESGQIPVALAIWAPPVASILLAVGVLLHLEDG